MGMYIQSWGERLFAEWKDNTALIDWNLNRKKGCEGEGQRRSKTNK